MEQFGQSAKRIDASDVVSLLREVYPEGVRGRNEAEALIAFDREYSDPAPEWRGFMAEAVADHLLRRSEPIGIVTDEKADWLIHAIAPSGRIATPGGRQALLRTIAQANDVAVGLRAFAIRSLAGAKVLDAHDVEFLRATLKSGSGPIIAEEAEALFDLHDAVADKRNHVTFEDLFFRAIVNYLLHASEADAPSREIALAREPRRDSGQRIAAEAAAWLATRIMRDGQPTSAELALLSLIGGETEPGAPFTRSFGRAA